MKNILMCYDDYLVIDLVRISLEEKGVNIIGSSTCKEVETKINDYNPILVILDWNMVINPENLVLDLLNSKRIPVAIFSSNLNGRKSSEEAGVDFFVKKSPFGFDELEKIVDQVLLKERIAL